MNSPNVRNGFHAVREAFKVSERFADGFVAHLEKSGRQSSRKGVEGIVFALQGEFVYGHVGV